METKQPKSMNDIDSPSHFSQWNAGKARSIYQKEKYAHDGGNNKLSGKYQTL